MIGESSAVRTHRPSMYAKIGFSFLPGVPKRRFRGDDADIHKGEISRHL